LAVTATARPDNPSAVVIGPREFLVKIDARNRRWHPGILRHTDDPIEMPQFALGCEVANLYRAMPLTAR
jgi:hypothetical protein